MTQPPNVIPLGPRIRARVFQDAVDEAAAERGLPPEPWRLRPRRAASRPRREREQGGGSATLNTSPRLRLVQP